MSALLNEEPGVVARPSPTTVFKGDSSAAAYAFEQGDSATIVDLVRQTGALLFRGFDVSTPAAFKQVVERVVPELNDYRGGTSPRTKIDEGVYTSTEYPNQFEISLHNEMSYSATAPEFLFLSCIVEPHDRGETPLADCRSVLRRLSPELVQVFRRRKVKYQRNFFGRKSRYNSWAKAFETTDPNVVERYCLANDIRFAWMPNDQLRTWEVRDALRVHPVTGEEVWFNQVNLWHFTNSPLAAASLGMQQEGLPMNAFFGDGGELDRDMLAAIRFAYAEEKRLCKWKTGDFLMLDNTLVAHGRMPFRGERKIVVAMGSSTR